MEVTIDLKIIINKLQAAFDRTQKLEEELMQYKEAARSEAQFVNELQEENKKLKSLIKDLVNNGMDFDIATRMEELGIGEK